MASDPAIKLEVKAFDVEYRRDADDVRFARIFQPQGAGPFPALVQVHGGAWFAGDRMSNESMNESLAATGMVIASIDFRKPPEHPYPVSLVDVNYATRWLKAHAPDFNADASRLGLRGVSSGGHLAMLSAMRPRDPRYAALPLPEDPELDASVAYVIGCWPILDPYARYFFAQETGRQQLATRTEGMFGNREGMQEASPQLILDRGETVELPPLLILQGTEDQNVTPAMQERFAVSYRVRGGDVQLEIFPGMPHGFVGQNDAANERAMRHTSEFIARQLAGRIAV
jgi:acetyl esterase